MLVEIDITDIVWDDNTDGTYEYTVDRIDEFIDELGDDNKILPKNYYDCDSPVILIQINEKLISHTSFKPEDWDEDAPNLSLFFVLDFYNSEDLNNYFLSLDKSFYSYFPKNDYIIYQAYDYGKYHDFVRGYYNPKNESDVKKYINYSKFPEMMKIYEAAKNILL